MRTHEPGRQFSDGGWGQTRKFISSNASSIHLEPGPESFTLAWSTKEPAVPTIQALIDQEIRKYPPRTAILVFKEYDEYPWRDWLKVWNKFCEAVTNFPESVQYVRFDFPRKSISLSSVEPHYTLGIAYRMDRKGVLPVPSDVQAVRNVFLATADPSIRSELDWVIENIIT